jgi:hypothetical protein
MGGHVVDANNRLLSDGVFNYDYDAEGNRILKEDIVNEDSVEYEWDYRNRLSKVTFKDDLGAPTKIVIQIYDSFNRWIGQQVDTDGDTDIDEVAFFAYDGNQMALEFDGAADSDLTNRYLWGEQVDQILADEQVTSLGSAGDVLWPLTDHLNTVRDLAEYTDGPDTTAVANHIEYNRFGLVIDETDDGVDSRFGFTARPFDEETQLQNNLHRWLRCLGFSGQSNSLFFKEKEGRSDGPDEGEAQSSHAAIVLRGVQAGSGSDAVGRAFREFGGRAAGNLGTERFVPLEEGLPAPRRSGRPHARRSRRPARRRAAPRRART